MVGSATTTTELHDQLVARNGPVLNEADRALPLTSIKAQVNGLLDQAAAQLARKQQQLPSSDPLLLLPTVLRHAVASDC